MRWYRLSDRRLEDSQQALRTLYREWGNLAWLAKIGEASQDDLRRKEELAALIQQAESERDAYQKERDERIEALKGSPHLMSPEEFMSYHKTGGIASHAYEDYQTSEGISWLGSPDRYPILVKSQEHGGETIEYRKKDERLDYVKHDDKGDIMRDEKGMAVFKTPEEIRAAGLPETDTTIVAFNQEGQPVGFASNEFGSDGIWVVNDYQKKGIGTELLDLFRSQFKADRKMGQMTFMGENLARAYHKRLVEKAIQQGLEVPPETLEEYGL